MSSTRRAVIDVGTNSIKLLVADVAGHHVQRCGGQQADAARQRFLQKRTSCNPSRSNKRAGCGGIRGNGAEWKAASVRIFATSAARDAVNAADLVSAIEHASGLEAKIISGEQEADWVFKGVTTDEELARQPLLILDVGGGSTEFILGHGEHKDFRHSFPLGTVRLLEKKMPHSDPPTAKELAGCRNWLEILSRNRSAPETGAVVAAGNKIEPRYRPVLLVGTGGTTSILRAWKRSWRRTTVSESKRRA